MNLYLIQGKMISLVGCSSFETEGSVLIDYINSSYHDHCIVIRWVIPVLPGGELEVLLEHCIELCRRKLDTDSEECQRFFREGLTISFQKIMTDEAVSSWR